MQKRKASRKKRDPLPEHFGSIEEAGDFWDTHDSEDYPEIWKPVEHFEIAPRNLRTSEIVDLVLDEDVKAGLEKVARKRRTSLDRLVNEWLREKLAELGR